MTLKVPLRDIAESSLAARWRGRVPDGDVQFALHTGMSALDVNLLRTFSAGRWLLIVRCPKRAGMVFQGVLPPKPQGLYDAKTSNETGTMQLADGRLVVSDIDLMSVWQGAGDRWEKVFTPGPPRGGGWWGSEKADRIMRQLLPRMQSPFDHGCNDDFRSAKNQGVTSGRFAAFMDGAARYLGSPAALRAFYAEQKIDFPYDSDGKYTGPVR